MPASTDDSAIPDYLWRVWAAQGKRKRATARKVWALAVVLLLIATAIYFVVAR